jgi:probable rRNA maturation factor
VLTFVYGDSQPLAGDIAICIPVVEREAALQGKTAEAHLAHLVMHGMLHLQGFDHERQVDAELMEGVEAELVMKLGYPDPYGQG